MGNRLKALGVITGGALLIVVATATPAMAGAASCSGGISGECTTNSVPANSSGHFIDIHVNSSGWCGSDYKLIDTANGKTVANGYVGSGNSFDRRVPGLYSSYKASIDGCSGCVIVIDNNP